ncbi:MAG: PAS domain-containing protein [Synechococcaceae cyanobacterium SM2_3_1]|nr:PAS domain-containing protein [Synechococcaceae cyanobacterium SM2_3_1]
MVTFAETRLQQLGQQSDLQDQLRTLEKRLLTTQTRLEQALKAAHMGAWEWDLLTDQERWWPEIEHLGSTGSHHDFLMRVHPDDRDWVMQAQLGAIQGRQPYQAVFRVVSPDGKLAWKSSQGTLLLNDRGEPIRMVGISADVTEQKQAEQALKEAVAAADAANRAKSSFLANMTHELRTPMNAILGFCQLLARDENLTPQQQQSLRVISRSGEHLLNQINAVLDMSKIEAGQISLQEQPSDLWGLLTEIQDLFEPRIQAKLLQFQLTIGREVPQILVVDATKLRQVLTNLLANALKFTHQGEITLSVTLEAQDQESYLCLVVQDTGEGIGIDEIPQLFQPFVQSSSGIRSQQGTGLGLCICQQYVHLMGGSIALTSQLGQGSTFIIQIPCKCSITDHTPEDRSAVVSTLISASPSPGNDLVQCLALQPLEWRQELFQASLHLDRERVLHCIHTLSEEDADLAQILIQWVEDFRFDHLSDLLQILPHE